MSKRKGLSMEEKRKRMLDLFYEKKDVFQLKELEKLGPAEKGVIAQSVKDVVTELVSEGLVDSEKIGTSVYFWAFPSKNIQERKRKVSDLETKVDSLRNQKDSISQLVKRAKVERADSDERDKLNQKVVELEAEKARLTKLIAQYKDSDPDQIKKEKAEIKTAYAAATRWTDNIFSVCEWLKRRFNMEQSQINVQFEIPEAFDYPDELQKLTC